MTFFFFFFKNNKICVKKLEDTTYIFKKGIKSPFSTWIHMRVHVLLLPIFFFLSVHAFFQIA